MLKLESTVMSFPSLKYLFLFSEPPIVESSAAVVIMYGSVAVPLPLIADTVMIPCGSRDISITIAVIILKNFFCIITS